MIIVIRGTNGSGKSHAVRQILSRRSTEVTGYRLNQDSTIIKIAGVQRPVLVIGPYIEGRSMGGCDCIRRPSEIYELIMYGENYLFHVLLEGVVLATKPYIDLFDRGHDVRYAFFDPPMSRCLANIRARQRKKGQQVAVSREAMARKLERARAMYVEAEAHGLIVERFRDPARDAVPWIMKQLRSA
jgi:hypothetical protein